MKPAAKPLRGAACALALFSVTGVVARPAVAKPSNAAIVAALTDMAKELNKAMPKQLDATMRIDSVVASAVALKFTYNYTLNAPLREINAAKYLASLKAPLVQSVCTHPDMETFRTYGVAVVYSFRARDGVPAGTIEASPADCK